MHVCINISDILCLKNMLIRNFFRLTLNGRNRGTVFPCLYFPNCSKIRILSPYGLLQQNTTDWAVYKQHTFTAYSSEALTPSPGCHYGGVLMKALLQAADGPLSLCPPHMVGAFQRLSDKGADPILEGSALMT